MDQIEFHQFEAVDVRVGKIVSVEEFPEARRPSYRMQIDFGPEIGIKKSCAQLPENYARETLEGMQVICVLNFPPRQIGPAMSEVLTLGVPDENGQPVLLTPERNVPLGGKMY